MKSSLTVLSHSLLMPLIVLLPGSLLQASVLSVPQKTTPIHREDRIIAQLSRSQADFSLSKFDPQSDAFSFTNEDLAKDISQITNNEGWNKYLTQNLQWLFGPGVCTNEDELKKQPDGSYSFNKCKLSVPAKEWLNDKIRSMQYGVCEGMSTASLYLWLAKNNPNQYKARTSFFRDIDESEFKNLQTTKISDLNKDQQALREYIANFFILQSVAYVYQPTGAIEKMKNHLKSLNGLLRL